MSFFRFALITSIFLWVKKRIDTIVIIALLAISFNFIDYFYSDLQKIYPKKQREELVDIYLAKSSIQLSILIVGTYLTIGLFTGDNKRTRQVKLNKDSRGKLIIETRSDYLVRKKIEEKHEQNYQ